MKYALFSVIIIMMLAACKKLPCDKPGPYRIVIHNVDSTVDSFVTITKYTKGANFTNPIDSSIKLPMELDNAMGSTTAYQFNEQFEYLITITPAGKSYKITDIHFGNEYQRSGSTAGLGELPACVQSFGYSINGTVKEQPEIKERNYLDVEAWIEINN